MILKKETDEIVKFIKDEVTNAGKKGCIVGISGGIDSAVVLLLCKQAFPNDTFGISMQVEGDRKNSTDRASELCRKYHIPFVNKQIKKFRMNPTIPSVFGNQTIQTNNVPKKAIGNYYARQRMTTLYLYAEMMDCLVVGTDNKSENFIGYFTKYGDGGVDINPIGQYFKSEVRKLSEFLGVTKEIIEAKPSAELWEDQTDEGELGFTYDELEEAIKFIEKDEENVEQTELIYNVRKMHNNTGHKRIIPKEYERRNDV